MRIEKSNLYLTLNGKVVLGFWMGGTKDGGFCFGPIMPDGDIHLTVLEDKGKFRYHIKHRGIKEPLDESPIGGQTSTKLVAVRIQEMATRRLEIYHGNRTCWAFTLARWRKIQALMPRFDVAGNFNVPLEFVFAELDMDFSKKRMWRKTRIRALLTAEPYFGFLEDGRGRRLVKPVTNDTMLAWPLSKTNEIQQYFLNVLGFEEFVDYLINTVEGKRLLRNSKRRMKQLSRQN